MVKFALLVILNAKPGQEAAVEAFLMDSQPIVQDDPEPSRGSASV